MVRTFKTAQVLPLGSGCPVFQRPHPFARLKACSLASDFTLVLSFGILLRILGISP